MHRSGRTPGTKAGQASSLRGVSGIGKQTLFLTKLSEQDSTRWPLLVRLCRFVFVFASSLSLPHGVVGKAVVCGDNLEGAQPNEQTDGHGGRVTGPIELTTGR
jgi:hypothetical protein